ncbi:MAG: tetratricopeptide repeat protein [Candidatus Ryanbacteria bacterium]|nr:tetratricopeptide repeat protein [Candidatus Ryanbacteria bacterium]
MKKQLLPGLIAFFVIFIIGGTFWYFTRPSPPVAPASRKNETTPPPPPLVGSQDVPKPPEGFAELKDNNRTMRESLRKDLKEKFSEIIKRLETEPGDSALWVDLGSIKYAFDDFNGAEDAWKYAIEINLLADAARMNLAALYQYKVPNYPEAERMLRMVIENNPPDAIRVYAELFDLYRYRYSEKAHLAEGVMLEAYRRYPAEHAILKTLAWYYLEQKNEARAIEYFEKYLEKDPTDVSAQEELARLRQ